MDGALSNNYDRAAAYYDTLGTLIFAGTLFRSQTVFLSRIPAGAGVLIAGGGTGKLLEELAHTHPEGLRITYLEISKNMLARARRRNTGKNRVKFVQASFLDYTSDEPFDIIITPFLLDNFTETGVRKGIDAVYRNLSPEGNWLFTDFIKPVRSWQRWLLWGMYAFFRRRAGVEAQTLVPPEAMMEPRFVPVEEAYFYRKFIRAAVYRKR